MPTYVEEVIAVAQLHEWLAEEEGCGVDTDETGSVPPSRSPETTCTKVSRIMATVAAESARVPDYHEIGLVVDAAEAWPEVTCEACLQELEAIRERERLGLEAQEKAHQRERVRWEFAEARAKARERLGDSRRRLEENTQGFWDFDASRLARSETVNMEAFRQVQDMDVRSLVDGEGVCGLFLYGGTGCGKTLAVVQAARKLVENGWLGCIRFVGEEQMKAVYSDPNAPAEEKEAFTDELLDCDLLIIDDLGLASFSPAYGHQLANLVDRMHRDALPALWVTVQCDASRLAKKWASDSNGAMEKLAERTVRRIKEMCRPGRFDRKPKPQDCTAIEQERNER